MLVFNLTDVSTSTLKAQGLVGVSITVGGTVIPAGESRTLKSLGSDAQRFLQCGALSLTQPLEYLQAKGMKVLSAVPVSVPVKPQQFATLEVVDTVPVVTNKPSLELEVDDSRLSRKERKRLGR